MVSNEDRDAAAQVVALALAEGNDLQVSRRRVQHARRVVADLVSHGWGPRPRLARDDLVMRLHRTDISEVVRWLKWNGIEVTDE